MTNVETFLTESHPKLHQVSKDSFFWSTECGVFGMSAKEIRISGKKGLHLILGFRRLWLEMRAAQKLVAASLPQNFTVNSGDVSM